MALEAAYQTFSEDHPVDKISEYTLRDIVIHAAMRIPEGDQGREVIFNLEKRHASNSDSYKFKISSVTQVDGVWTDHCRGEIMPHREMDSKSLPQFHKQLLGPNDRRILDSQKWYNTFTETGLGYGRAFQGILNLTSDPQMNTVAADIDLDPTKGLFKNIESSYLIHPASLDACFQLSIIAGFNGHSEIAQNAYIPVSFKRISIFCPDEPPTPFGTAICHSSRRGIRRLYAQTQLTNLSGVPLVDVEDLRCVAYGERSNIKESVRKPYRNLVWKPDINSMSSSAAYAMFSSTVAIEKELVNGLSDLNRLSAYVVVEIAKNFAFQSRSTAQHVENFISWARNCAETDLPFIEEARYCKNRSAVISSLSTQMKGRTEVRLIKRVFDNLESIIDGSTTGLEVALQDGLLNQLYASSVGIAGAYPQLRRIIELCAHQNPHMDILEIGAGTGGATRIVLEALQADSDEKLFEKYTFTDISTAFLSPAQAQFDFCSTSMAYGTLDIESDPGDQGYEQRYDLVIASESLHTVEKIEKALRHSRMLLRPGGRLIIVETTRALIGHGLVLGTFPDYWVGKEEGRFDSPFMTAAQWDTVLKRAGFSGIDVRLDDYPQPWNIASVLVATVAMEPVVSIDKSDSVWLIGVPRLKDFSELLASQFAQHNVHVERACEKVPQNAQVIWFLPADIWKDVKWFTTAKWLVQQSRSIIWITEKDDNDSFNGSMAIVQGAVRVIAAENPHLHHTVIDIQKKANECDLGLATELVKLVLESRAPHPPQMQDREFIWKDQCLHISRLVPDLDRNNVFQLSQISDSIQSMSLGEQKPFKIAYEIPGMLLSNYFKEDRSFSTPIPEDYIVAKTKAMGLNWKDVAVATGRFDLNNSSTEFSGVITQIGAKVSDFSVGDHVYGLAFGHFGNYVRLPASFARRMPIESSFVDMATIPVVFTTALYAFRHVARLQPGELVLIQSGTGGLGIAAIQVAQMIGANIFATAGSKEKRAYLHEVFQIPSSHIFDSREIPSKRVLLQATDGRGFDVVLNTSSGFVMDSTWSAIAAKGRFVDIGRVDVHDHGSLYMEPFNRNASFSSFDLGRLDPPTLAELMGEVDTLVQANAIRPISPVTEFDIGNLGKALLNLSEGKHIGKMVVTYGDVNSMIRVSVQIHVDDFQTLTINS
jgi:NADPH:quinone reductase-like Zn-dependent oxidoreductase/SAM-dependent methyltransferase